MESFVIDPGASVTCSSLLAIDASAKIFRIKLPPIICFSLEFS